MAPLCIHTHKKAARGTSSEPRSSKAVNIQRHPTVAPFPHDLSAPPFNTVPLWRLDTTGHPFLLPSQLLAWDESTRPKRPRLDLSIETEAQSDSLPLCRLVTRHFVVHHRKVLYQKRSGCLRLVAAGSKGTLKISLPRCSTSLLLTSPPSIIDWVYISPPRHVNTHDSLLTLPIAPRRILPFEPRVASAKLLTMETALGTERSCSTTALALISASTLEYPNKQILETFIEDAVDSELAARYLLQMIGSIPRAEDGTSKDVELSCFLNDWTALVNKRKVLCRIT